MKVVCLGLDPKTLDHESVVAFRNRAYGELVEHYIVIVPAASTMTVHLSRKTTIYGIGGSNKMVQWYKVAKKLNELIRAGSCDVITAQDMYFLGFLGLLAAKYYRLGLEVQVLGIEKLTWFRKQLAQFVLARASVVRALSERIKGRVIHEFGVTHDRIRVVTIYVDVRKLGLDIRTLAADDAHAFARLTEEFRAQYGHTFNFVTVSRLVPIKRILLQIQALKTLIASGKSAVLHIVGTGPDEAMLNQYVHAEKLDASVIFHGYKTGMALGMFYLEGDCFLLTSDYEGWGMVIVEAATAGLPIIMTDVGCAGEFIVDGESGLVVPVGDGTRLTEAMERVMDSPTLRDQLARGAVRAVSTLPQFEVVLHAYKANWELADTYRL